MNEMPAVASPTSRSRSLQLLPLLPLVVAACGGGPHPLRFEPPALEVRYTRLEGEQKVGTAVQRRSADGAITQDARDTDDKEVLATTLRLGADGVPIAVTVSEAGKPAEQSLADGAWRDDTRSGPAAPGAYYFSRSWNELTLGLLARTLAADADRRIPLLPMGEATLAGAGELVVDGAGGAQTVTQVLVGGLERLPRPVWLDARGDLFAVTTGWEAMVREGYEAALPALLAAQEKTAGDQRAALARLAHPTTALVIRNARAFDPITLKITAGTSVVIAGGRITGVGPDAAVATPDGAEVLDAGGRFLMPGLWDNHAHLWDPSNPLLYVAAGVTTIRDMGNTTALPAWVARMDAGTEIGPRVLMARSISKHGDPWWHASQEDADTPAEIEAFVERHAALGYVQVKTRDIKPELVPVLVRAAHARGMHVSGHIPEGMTPREFAEAGTDEIQHLGFLAGMGFFPRSDPPLEPAAARARLADALAKGAPEVKEEIAVYASRHVAWDITALRASPTAQKSDVPAEYQHLVGKGPLDHDRAIPRGGGTPDGWNLAAALLVELHGSGVVVIPGTDGVGLAGYELVAELERWVKAGLPAPEVLRLATYTSAKNMKRDKELGTLAVGSFGDVILVDGDPTKDITNLRNVYRVVKGGTIYEPRALLAAMGIAP
jgi:cytosine/adenosine deaminase-related metal-dependent hydrolase